MNLPAKPEAVAHVSDAHWEEALKRSYPYPWDSISTLFSEFQKTVIDHARCLILLGDVQEPVDPISDAIDALYNDWMMTPYNSKNERSDLVTLCRKHFAGLSFPVQP